MATNKSPEPTRLLSIGKVDEDGNLHARTILSPKANTTRAGLAVPPEKIIPVIVIAGIMGSNLRAKTSVTKGEELKPGEAAWRPPNGKMAGLGEASKWSKRTPDIRQRILTAEMLEVDPTGEIDKIPSHSDETTCRARGWGEIHSDSYCELLRTLEENLNTTFRVSFGTRKIAPPWQDINDYDRGEWGTSSRDVGAPITIDELKKFSAYQYPVYAFGYNWLESNEKSASLLNRRIDSIIASWTASKRQCTKVMLITHSMGGMVARACARQAPEKIAGVIHGVMPALGAPACYRRLVCGTETDGPGKGMIDRLTMRKFAEIAGRTSDETTPVLALSSGPLELLPNHLYPHWLFAKINVPQKPYLVQLNFPNKNPYKFYRDFECWYRAINIKLADPAEKYSGRLEDKISMAIKQAEKFHTQILDTYYHPNSAAFYCADTEQHSFGNYNWTAAHPKVMSPAQLQTGKPVGDAIDGRRRVEFDKDKILLFGPSQQDTDGDGTVPTSSGAGPTGKALYTFKTVGYDHQGAYNNEAMLALTQHLVVKLLQKCL